MMQPEAIADFLCYLCDQPELKHDESSTCSGYMENGPPPPPADHDEVAEIERTWYQMEFAFL